MEKQKNKHAVELGRLGGYAGKGKRSAAARKAANARWNKPKPIDIDALQKAVDEVIITP